MVFAIKKEVFNNAETLNKLWNIDLEPNKSSWKDVHITIAANSMLNKLSVSTSEQIKFKEDFA